MKKLIALVMVLALSLSLVPAFATDAVPTIVWWQIGTQPANLEEGVAKINEYIIPKIGVQLEIKVAGWGEFDTKVNTIVNTGEEFDIMFCNNTHYNRFVDLGAFADITELLANEASDLYAYIPELVWGGTNVKGGIYAVPTYKDSAITQYYVWDNAIVEKYNIDYTNIKSMADLDAALRTIKDGEGAGYYPLLLGKGDGFSGLFNDYDDMTVGLKPIGVHVKDGEKKVVSTLEQADIMDQLKLLHAWYQDGLINPDAPTLDDAPLGKAFFTAQAWPGAEPDYQIKEGVEKYVMQDVFGPIYTTSSIQGSLNAISANSKYKTEALLFLQLANLDPHLRNMLAYGIEGDNWEYTDEENVINRLNDVWTLPGYSQATFFTRANVAPNPGNMMDGVKALNERADSSVINGFALDISDLSTEIANCHAVWDKYRYELLTGASDPETVVPLIITELQAAGMDAIISEAQKQIDAL